MLLHAFFFARPLVKAAGRAEERESKEEVGRDPPPPRRGACIIAPLLAGCS